MVFYRFLTSGQSNVIAMNDHSQNGTLPKITLYTNHACPYAHRAHITLKELGLAYEEVFIDLATPREPWYLEINPVRKTSSLFYIFSMPSILDAYSGSRFQWVRLAYG